MIELRQFFFTTALILTSWSGAHACAMSIAYDFSAFGKADIVQSVKILSYKRIAIAAEQNSNTATIGLFLFEPLPMQDDRSLGTRAAAFLGRRIKGPFSAFLQDGPSNLPANWLDGAGVIVGLQVGVTAEGKPEIFVAGDGCDGPALKKNTDENWNGILLMRRNFDFLLNRCRYLDPAADITQFSNPCI